MLQDSYEKRHMENISLFRNMQVNKNSISLNEVIMLPGSMQGELVTVPGSMQSGIAIYFCCILNCIRVLEFMKGH